MSIPASLAFALVVLGVGMGGRAPASWGDGDRDSGGSRNQLVHQSHLHLVDVVRPQIQMTELRKCRIRSLRRRLQPQQGQGLAQGQGLGLEQGLVGQVHQVQDQGLDRSVP